MSIPRIALAQFDVLAVQPALNVARMLGLIERARAAGAEMVVFSELCVSGYLIGDLWEVDAVVADFADYSDEICRASTGMTVVFGNVVVDASRIGEDGRARKYNAAVVCHDGAYVARTALPPDLPPGTQPKTLHPNYRFFDDDRHFYSVRKLALEAGSNVYDWAVPFEVETSAGRTFRFGVELCEDLWSDDYFYEGETLHLLSAYRERSAELVVSLSASPWSWRKSEKRDRTIRSAIDRARLPLLYVNNIGTQNNGKNFIVFDGDTTAYDSDGVIRYRARPWEEDLSVIDFDVASGAIARAERVDAQLLARDANGSGGAVGDLAVVDSEIHQTFMGLTMGLRHLDHIRGAQNRFLIGVSGGIDSSVVLALLVHTFGADRVLAVNMPTRFNSEETQTNARDLCQALSVPYLSCSIESLYSALAGVVEEAAFGNDNGRFTQLVDENIQARIRGADVLAGLASKFNCIFTNNGNKTETALGYATLYGDVNGAIAPIADLYKTQVFDLARYLNETVYGRLVIPENLYDGTIVPSAELSADQDVTKGLGDPIKYGYHDALLRRMIEYRQHSTDLMRAFLADDLFAAIDWDDAARFRAYFDSSEAWLADLMWVENQLRINYFKRIQAPPIIVASKRAFGFDLRETQYPSHRLRDVDELEKRVLAHDIGNYFV